MAGCLVSSRHPLPCPYRETRPAFPIKKLNPTRIHQRVPKTLFLALLRKSKFAYGKTTTRAALSRKGKKLRRRQFTNQPGHINAPANRAGPEPPFPPPITAPLLLQNPNPTQNPRPKPLTRARPAAHRRTERTAHTRMKTRGRLGALLVEDEVLVLVHVLAAGVGPPERLPDGRVVLEVVGPECLLDVLGRLLWLFLE